MRSSTARASGPAPRSDVSSAATRRAATRHRSAPAPSMTVAGSVSGAKCHRCPLGAAEVEGDRTRELPAVSGERVRQCAPRQTCDVLEAVRRFLHRAQRLGDVAGVDPALGQACGRQCLGGQLTADPRDASVRIARRERVARARPRRIATVRAARRSEPRVRAPRLLLLRRRRCRAARRRPRTRRVPRRIRPSRSRARARRSVRDGARRRRQSSLRTASAAPSPRRRGRRAAPPVRRAGLPAR